MRLRTLSQSSHPFRSLLLGSTLTRRAIRPRWAPQPAPSTTRRPPRLSRGPSTDESVNLGNNDPVVLFNGKDPPNEFMVQILANGESCFINDDGPAGPPANIVSGGFLLPNGFAVSVPVSNAGFPPPPVATFVTPPGYKPMGPVSVWCAGNGAAIAARSW
jgi:hypothetical protein